MKIKDIIKKQTTLIALAVIVVVVATLSVSYAIFFDVSTNKSDQVITAGNLALTLKNGSTQVLKEVPVTNETEAKKGTPVTFTIENTGNLPATYKLYLYATGSDSNILSNLKVYAANTKYTTSTKNLTALTTDTTTPTSCTGSGSNCKLYLFDDGTLTASGKKENVQLYLWIDEENVEDEINGMLNLNIYMINEVDETAATTAP